MKTLQHQLSLDQAKSLVMALISNYNIPADKGDLELTESGDIVGEYRLGGTLVRLTVSITQEAPSRFAAAVVAHTSSDLMPHYSALSELLNGFQALENYLRKVLWALKPS